MDVNEMASYLGIGDEDAKELINLLITTSLEDLEKMETGLKNKDPRQIASAAHSIKGAAGNLNFMELSQEAANLEESALKSTLDDALEKIILVRQKIKAIQKMTK